MTTAPDRLLPEGPSGRVVTMLVVAVAAAAFGFYGWWRLGSSLDGAFVPFAAILLVADLVVVARFGALVAPALGHDLDATVDAPTSVPRVDVIVVVDDQSARSVRLTLRSCREVRGSDGLIVVALRPRPDIVQLCRHLEVPFVDQRDHPNLGIEPNRRAPFLLLVPAGVLVSPDTAVVLTPAFTDGDVGAVVGAITVHSSVELIGSRGYQLLADGDERAAARLDRAGAAPPLDGPILFHKRALADTGGVAWDRSSPVLSAHQHVLDAGWRTRFVHPPVAYRMDAPNETTAQLQRQRRSAMWRDCARHRGAGDAAGRSRWARWARSSVLLDLWSALPRAAVLALPALAAATGRMPIRVDDPVRGALAACLWFGSAAAVRWRLTGRRPHLFGQLRAGTRTLGVDVAAVVGRTLESTTVATRWHLGSLGLLLGSSLVPIWISTTDDGSFTTAQRVALGVAGAGVALLVRDAATAFRQQRHLPRVTFQSRGYHDLVDLSPQGYAIDATDAKGTRRTLDIDLPLPDRRTKRVVLDGIVSKSTVRDGTTVAVVKIAPDTETFDDLYYYCAVTAPTIRWMGGSARVEAAKGYRRSSALPTARGD